MKPKEIKNYIKEITPNKEDIPNYFIKMVMESKKSFELRVLDIESILNMDNCVKQYVLSGDIRYDEYSEHEPHEEDLKQPIIIFNNEVIDGYSRLSEHFRREEKTINAYVSI